MHLLVRRSVKLYEVVYVNEFRVECYISDENANDTNLFDLDEQELIKWKKDMEVRALGEYYSKKIKLTSKKN